MNVDFRPMTPEDWPLVSDIYRQGIETHNATFETLVPSWETWDLAHISSCRIVATIDDIVVGWVALVPVSSRKVYCGVGAISIYVSGNHKGKGIGSGLLNRLIEESEREGFWTLQAGIFPENIASINLHKKHGFRIVGHRNKIGKMQDTWRDTLLLERRSPTVGL